MAIKFLTVMFCIKKNIKGVWFEADMEELKERVRLSQNVIPKELLPALGFDKQIGKTVNAQLYPTRFIVLELDAPRYYKVNPDKQDDWRVITRNRFSFLESLYEDLKYYWMYLTSSECGIRFILKVDIPIDGYLKYKALVECFLKDLEDATKGEINDEQHDLHVNQAWYIPSNPRYFYTPELIYPIDGARIEECLNKPPIIKADSPKNDFKLARSSDKFLTAERFTQRSITYLNGSRNKYVFHLACNLNRFGIYKSDAIEYICQHYDLGHKEIQSAVTSAYKNIQDFSRFN